MGESLKDLKNIREILVIALGRERQALQFYLDAAESTRDETRKKEFLKLADWEGEHVRYVSKLLSEVERKIERAEK